MKDQFLERVKANAKATCPDGAKVLRVYRHPRQPRCVIIKLRSRSKSGQQFDQTAAVFNNEKTELDELVRVRMLAAWQ